MTGTADIALARDIDTAPWTPGAALPLAIRGDVQPGRRQANATGLPTANVKLREIRLSDGSYAARARLPGGIDHPALALVNGDSLLRTFIFDFNGDLAGQTLTTCLVAMLRPAKRFADDDALRRQLLLDCRGARLMLDLEMSGLLTAVVPAPHGARWPMRAGV